MPSHISYAQGSKVQSFQLFQQAKEWIPGGVTANIKHFSPHPIFMKCAKGSKLIDVDGQEYIDYLLCYGALITGHGHQAVTNAVKEQLDQTGTTVFGTPHELELTLAKKLVDLYPGIDMVRYTNSGLEATLLAIRLARAYTGKDKIGKFEGHYHGGFNHVLVSVNPELDDAGSKYEPIALPESSGIPEHELKQTLVLPFNDLQSTKDLLRKYASELAAVIIEPVQGGFIRAEQEFIEGLREITEELNIVLIFDEVKTGFRVHLGGAQSVYGVKPDLTALGKVLGGGYPIGALGGSKEMMMLCAPTDESDVFSFGQSSRKKTDVVFHSGTYNGHPVVLAAGLATISLLEENGVMEVLFAKTNHLRTALEKLYTTYQIPMHTCGMGSIFNLIFSKNPIRNYRDLWGTNHDLRMKIDMELLHQGIYIKPGNRYSMSISHTQQDIDKTVEAHEKAIKKVLSSGG